ncbi:multi-sensor signal transduction histidine kinase [Magnetococcus marinus MC-1]|uniref:histidine kinase n=1 Tax=Magnetococcus marinus (strain ATCC BAA-1437 / JCM 17883 / MC-1) TaxID=156889 RepID=A0LC28_MAGMM|nr:PAS domain S-box protein [Magnetococcus marinus]ABK45521.1 multi-sensor signal transduction histidine kinase [Magnetococcus marinus MC-1]
MSGSCGKKLKILCVDDNKDFPAFLQHRLAHDGFEWVWVQEQGAILAEVQAGAYDAILIDYHLKGSEDGIDLLRRLLQEGDNVPPVIMVAHEATVQVAVTSIRLGATDFVYRDDGANFADFLSKTLHNAINKSSLMDAMARSERRFKALVESSNDWIWAVDAEGVYTYSSPMVEQMLGYSPAEMMGKTPFDLMPHDEAQRVRANFQVLVEQRRPIEKLVNRNRHKNGHLVVLESCGVPIFDEEGHFAGYQGVDRDITDRVILEEQNEKIRARLERAQQLAHLGSWDWDYATNLLTCSDEVYRIFERPLQPQAMPAEQFLEVVHVKDRALVHEALQRAFADPNDIYDIEYRIRRPAGDVRVVRAKGDVVRDAAGKALRMVGTVQDITEIKQAEWALEEARDAWKRTFNAITEPILIVDTHYKIVRCNRAMAKVLGISQQKIQGMPCYEALHGVKEPFEACPHGQLLSQSCPNSKVLLEARLGGNYEVSVYPIHAVSGELTGSIHIAHDLTERKKAEEKERYASFQAGVAEMSVSILHNIGNVIMGIMSRSDMIGDSSKELKALAGLFGRVGESIQNKRAQGKGEGDILNGVLSIFDELSSRLAKMSNLDFTDNAEKIRTGIQHISEIIKIHQDASHYMLLTHFDLRDLLNDAVLIQADKLEKFHIELTLECEDGLENIYLPRSQLLQLVINLIKNSQEAIGQRLSTDPAAGWIHIVARRDEGGGLMLQVQDNGCGIAPEQVAHVFRFGYTTKNRGTGFGLHSAASFVQSMQGKLEVESAGIGQGCLFRLHLPLTGEDVKHADQ